MDRQDHKLLISLTKTLGRVVIESARAVVMSKTAANPNAAHGPLAKAEGQLQACGAALELETDRDRESDKEDR